jgi:hypothetical protein
MLLFKRGLTAFGIFALLALLTTPISVLAHERRTISDGKYDVVVGWDVEPAFVGQKNAASIRISKAGSSPAVPIEGADKTLKVQIRQGAQTKEFGLRAVFGQPGYYVADIVPEREGDYQWTFVGSINEDKLNDRFDTADKKFNGVEAITPLQFPSGVAADPALATSTAQVAQADAQTARTFGLAGIVVGVLGLAVALYGMRRRSGSTAFAAPLRTADRT